MSRFGGVNEKVRNYTAIFRRRLSVWYSVMVILEAARPPSLPEVAVGASTNKHVLFQEFELSEEVSSNLGRKY